MIIDRVSTNIHRKDVIQTRMNLTPSANGESTLVSYEYQFFKEVTKIEDRFTLFRQSDKSDFNISTSIFAIRFSVCDFLLANVKNNVLVKMLKRKSESNFDGKTCPFKAGLKMTLYNQTYEDALLPPVPQETLGRLHKESFGRVKGMKGWLILYTQDSFFRVKK